jgi:hypothetical protein
MALTVPPIDDLATFQNVEEVEDPRGEMALQQATDLMAIATGLSEDPTDPIGLRMMSWGILDMSWKILVGFDNREESYTPYSSERIGSYSYSKMLQQAQQGEATGVEFFDSAVAYLTGLVNGNGSIMSASGEFVMNPAQLTELQIETLEHYRLGIATGTYSLYPGEE